MRHCGVFQPEGPVDCSELLSVPAVQPSMGEVELRTRGSNVAARRVVGLRRCARPGARVRVQVDASSGAVDAKARTPQRHLPPAIPLVITVLPAQARDYTRSVLGGCRAVRSGGGPPPATGSPAMRRRPEPYSIEALVAFGTAKINQDKTTGVGLTRIKGERYAPACIVGSFSCSADCL